MKIFQIIKNSLRVMILATLVMFCNCKKETPETKPEVDKDSEINQKLLLQLVNSYRASGCDCGSEGYFASTASVVWNNQLEQAAQDHCDDMFTNKIFSHSGSNGSDPGTRLKQHGYLWKTYGENIALGYQTEKSVIEGWIKSPGHCRNIMNPAFKEIGAARKGSYWTLTLGTR